MKKYILPILILFEIIFIPFIIIKIHQKRQKVLSAESVNVLDKKDYTFSPSDQLKYFYEPKRNDIQILSAELTRKLGYPDGTIIKTTINAHGLNQPDDFDPKKEENMFRIMTLGDSYTYGINVNTPDNY